jgi:toxin YoeB
MYKLEFYKRATVDKQNLKACRLLEKAEKLYKALSQDPKPLYSKPLSGDLQGAHSIRINLQHRLVYEIIEEEKVIKIIRMWGHYE